MKNKKAFTLIELVSVLVILAILALIVTPLVLNIIRKARTAADKRSIDAYGRSIELAIADYLLDNGAFPTSIDQLTIEYTGDRVVCSTTQLNSDSSVYLAECTVNSRAVTGYTYGKEETVTYDTYSVGDEVTYNNVDYYVIKNSSASEANVTLLKKTPLTVEEINTYGGVGTENNHVNMYVTEGPNASYYQTAYDNSGVGGMAYYSSTSCGWNGSEWVDSGCTTNYADSEIKYVVDAWAAAKTTASDLRTDSTGYKARLLTKDEYSVMTKVETYETPTEPGTRYVPMYDWMYSNDYWYWTMSSYEDSTSVVWFVGNGGGLNYGNYSLYNYNGTVRPVIVLAKSALN